MQPAIKCFCGTYVTWLEHVNVPIAACKLRAKALTELTGYLKKLQSISIKFGKRFFPVSHIDAGAHVRHNGRHSHIPKLSLVFFGDAQELLRTSL